MHSVLTKTLILLPTLLGCPGQTETMDTGSETASTTGATVTTETMYTTSTTAPSEVSVLDFSTSEGEIVNARILTIALDSPAQISVDCSADVVLGDYEETHKVTASGLAANHILQLNGLLPETTYSCVTSGATKNAMVDFTTQSLPGNLKHIFESPTGTSHAGFMLINAFDNTGDFNTNHWLLIMDYWGNIRWYVDASIGNGMIGLEYIPDQQTIIAGGGWETSWKKKKTKNIFYPPSIYGLNGALENRLLVYGDHDIDYSNGSVYLPISKTYFTCISRWSIASSWEKTGSWCVGSGVHANSVAVTEDETAILMTSFFQIIDGEAPKDGVSGVVKLDTASGEVVWQFSPDGDGDFSVNTLVEDYYLLHDISIVDCESDDHEICILFYDNGTPARSYSQILRYGLDEDKMEATLLRSFTRLSWWEMHSGGVDEVENGNWLIAIASLSENTRTSYLLVDPKGNQLWEMKARTSLTAGYRARWIDPCDIFNHTGMCTE